MDLTHPPAGPAASERPRASSVSSLGIEGGHRITRPPGSFASPMHTRTRRFSKPGPRPPGFVSRTATYHTLKDQKRLVEDQLRELQDTSSLTKLQKRVRSNVLDSEILMIEGEIAQLMAGSDCTTALESAKAACPHLQYADSFLSHLISQQQEPPAELPQDQLDVLSPLARTPSVLQVGLEVNLMVLRRTPSDGGGRLGESPMGSRSAQEGFEQPAQAEHEVFHSAYSPQSYATKKEMEVSPRTEMKVDSKAVLGIVRRLSLDTEPCVLKRTDSMEEHCALLMSKLDAVNDDGTRPSMQELAMGMGIYTTLHDSTGFGTVDAFAANDESRRWERASSGALDSPCVW